MNAQARRFGAAAIAEASRRERAVAGPGATRLRRSCGCVFSGLVVTLAWVLADASPAFAQSASTPRAASAPSVCVDAEVDGVRALSYDCLTRRLAPTEVPASRSVDDRTPSESLATQPSNRVGTFNLSAERNRFGANWGKSAQPQRPAAPVAVPIPAGH